MLGRRGGFTLIELLVVMAIVAVLLTLAVPRYFGRVEAANEAALRDDLHQMRDALDKYYGDNNRYPEKLDDLVTKRYLRRIPPDPMTGSDKTWIAVPPENPRMKGVADVKSGAEGNGRDGKPYKEW